MILSKNGEVYATGNKAELSADLFVILRVLRAEVGDEYVDMAVRNSKISDKEFSGEVEKAREAKEKIEEAMDIIKNLYKGEK